MFLFEKERLVDVSVLADLCAGVNCIYGTCHEGRCTCYEGYTGYYCETPRMKRIF